MVDEQNNAVSALYSVAIPLFNVDISAEGQNVLQFTFKPARTALEAILLDNFTITLFKWDSTDDVSKKKLEQYCHTKSLPEDFDFFDAFPQQHASGMLIVQVRELYSPGPGQNILEQLSNSFYADQIISSFERALKLYDDTEPHFYKGYYFRNGVNTGVIKHWPIKEMQGQPMQIDKDVLNSLNKLFLNLLTIDSSHRHSVGHRVIDIALRYYILSSRQTEYDVIFLMLMIAFEALFKKPNEVSISSARARFCKLLAENKAEHSQISKFMSEDKNVKGCCFLRNAIVHGDESASSIRSQTFWNLKSYIRKAIIRLVDATTNSNIDLSNYYDSLDHYVNSGFVGLPTK